MSKKGTKSNYSKGMKAEKTVGNIYKDNGWKVEYSPGSRGPADIKCNKGTTKHYVQVKSTSSPNKTPYISTKDIGNLNTLSSKHKAVPVIARVQPDNIDISYSRSNRGVYF